MERAGEFQDKKDVQVNGKDSSEEGGGGGIKEESPYLASPVGG